MKTQQCRIDSQGYGFDSLWFPLLITLLQFAVFSIKKLVTCIFSHYSTLLGILLIFKHSYRTAQWAFFKDIFQLDKFYNATAIRRLDPIYNFASVYIICNYNFIHQQWPCSLQCKLSSAHTLTHSVTLNVKSQLGMKVWLCINFFSFRFEPTGNRARIYGMLKNALQN